MSFNQMKASFSAILNRDDCTDAQATLFLQQGLQRIQRDCRLPNMERALLITPTAAPMLAFPVPTDLLQIIDVLVPTLYDVEGRMTPLKKMSYRALMSLSELDQPCAYALSQTQVYLRGAVPIGVQLQFLYYGNFSAFATADSENELSASTPDLGVYAALAYAGDNFSHPNAAQWESRYQAIKNEVIGMALDLANEGGPSAVEPLYRYED